MIFRRQQAGDIAHHQIRIALTGLAAFRAFFFNGIKMNGLSNAQFNGGLFSAFGFLPKITGSSKNTDRNYRSDDDLKAAISEYMDAVVNGR